MSIWVQVIHSGDEPWNTVKWGKRDREGRKGRNGDTNGHHYQAQLSAMLLLSFPF